MPDARVPRDGEEKKCVRAIAQDRGRLDGLRRARAKDMRDIDKVLNMLGLARRAGAIKIGQDDCLAERAARFFIIASDCSDAVRRKVDARVEAGSQMAALDADRSAMGAALGVSSAQIVALPIESGFVKKIKQLLEI